MKKVAIIYGGPGNEHEVSVNSAKNILENIDRNNFEVVEIFVGKNLEFNILNISLENGIKKNFGAKDMLVFSEKDIFNYLLEIKVEKVFLIFHGEYGEGGIIQNLLEKNNIDFVGSGSVASKNAIDKNISNEIFTKNNILIPKSKIINKEKFKIEEIDNFNFPTIVKPINEGSSVDLFKFENREDLEKDLKNIFKNHENMLMQECVIGREFTCGVIEIKNQYKNIKNKEENFLKALKVTEIILTKTKTFDYEAKYVPNSCEEITPANINGVLMQKLQDTALRCHKVLACKDISRTDMMLDKDNNIYVLETNTMPGMTRTSFFPAQLKADNISMQDFISNMLS